MGVQFKLAGNSKHEAWPRFRAAEALNLLLASIYYLCIRCHTLSLPCARSACFDKESACTGKVQAILLQVWLHHEGPKGLRIPGFPGIGTWRGHCCPSYKPAAFTSQGKKHLALFSVRGSVDSRIIVWPEKLSQWKNLKYPIGNQTCNLPVCSSVLRRIYGYFAYVS